MKEGIGRVAVRNRTFFLASVRPFFEHNDLTSPHMKKGAHSMDAFDTAKDTSYVSDTSNQRTSAPD